MEPILFEGPLPLTTHAARLAGPRRILIERLPMPALEPGKVLVQPAYVAICGTDIANFWSQSALPPVVIGHECAGRVVAVGQGSDKGLLGQRVAVAPLFNCEACDFCRAGKGNLCPKRTVFGVTVDGAMQEYISVPAGRVFPLPPGLPLQAGALAEPLAVACHAVRQAGSPPGGSPPGGPVLVLGAGAIGLLIAQAWRAIHGGSVGIADIDERRLRVAAGLGLAVYHDPQEAPRPSVLFEATGSAQAFSAWLPRLEVEGRAVVIGKVPSGAAVDWVGLMRKEARILTSRHFTLPDFEQALGLLGSGRVQVLPLIGDTIPFTCLAEQNGQTAMRKAQENIRILVQLDEDCPPGAG